jgi:hypothetical protein
LALRLTLVISDQGFVFPHARAFAAGENQAVGDVHGVNKRMFFFSCKSGNVAAGRNPNRLITLLSYKNPRFLDLVVVPSPYDEYF